MSAGDIVFMHRQSSYNKEAGVEGSNRWSKHYYMPAQSDRSAWSASCTAVAALTSKTYAGVVKEFKTRWLYSNTWDVLQRWE